MRADSLTRHAALSGEDRARHYIEHARIRIRTARLHLVAFAAGAAAGFLAGVLLFAILQEVI